MIQVKRVSTYSQHSINCIEHSIYIKHKSGETKTRLNQKGRINKGIFMELSKTFDSVKHFQLEECRRAKLYSNFDGRWYTSPRNHYAY